MESHNKNDFLLLGKGVEDIYKHITETFHPSAREVVTSAKAYLKALHGTTAASSLYLESLQRLANNSNAVDTHIGTSLAKLTSSFRELHNVQAKQLKSLYVDVILPLESNLEKDGKLIQSSMKKYQTQSKTKLESYAKSANTIKKKRNVSLDKEIGRLQSYHEERARAEVFFESARAEALTLAKRRYTFVLERHVSVSKNLLLYCEKGVELLDFDEFTIQNSESSKAGFDNCQCQGNKVYYRALYYYQGQDDGEHLKFDVGDLLLCSNEKTQNSNNERKSIMGVGGGGYWMWGENVLTSKVGWFPSSYVVLASNPKNDQRIMPEVPPPPPVAPPTTAAKSFHNDNNNHHKNHRETIYSSLIKSKSSSNNTTLNYPSSNEDSGVLLVGNSPLSLPDIDYDIDDDDHFHNQNQNQQMSHNSIGANNNNFDYSRSSSKTVVRPPTIPPPPPPPPPHPPIIHEKQHFNNGTELPSRNKKITRSNSFLGSLRNFDLRKVMNRTKSLVIWNREDEEDSDENLSNSTTSSCAFNEDSIWDYDDNNSVFETTSHNDKRKKVMRSASCLSSISVDNNRFLLIRSSKIVNGNNHGSSRGGQWYDLWGAATDATAAEEEDGRNCSMIMPYKMQ